MWPLPLFESYKKGLDSKIADMVNTGPRYGGALTAGLFLQSFVGEDIPWVHLDIAGPALYDSPHPFWGIGGTGAGVLTLLSMIEAR